MVNWSRFLCVIFVNLKCFDQWQEYFFINKQKKTEQACLNPRSSLVEDEQLDQSNSSVTRFGEISPLWQNIPSLG